MEDSDYEIEKILESMDGISKASPRPFFFTRLEARMMYKEKNVWEKLSIFLSRPIVAFASICLVLMINAFVIFSGPATSDSSNENGVELATVVDEYSHFNAQLNEFENLKP